MAKAQNIEFININIYIFKHRFEWKVIFWYRNAIQIRILDFDL